MNEIERIERFNRDLDQLLHGTAGPEASETPEEHRQALELAARLKDTDFSAAGRQEALLQERLLPIAEAQLDRRAGRRPAGVNWTGLQPAVAWVALALLLVTVLSWTIRNLIPAPMPAAELEPVEGEQGLTYGADFTQFRSERHHLSVALPPGWSIAEGAELLGPHFTGLVAFNSWGAEDFWTSAAKAGTDYSPDWVLEQIPPEGAYILLGIHGGETVQAYGPEHVQPHLETFWAGKNCRTAGDPAGYTTAEFFKWGRRFRLEVYCGPRASTGTASTVNALLESWQFDLIPAGDPGWATTAARLLLPDFTNPHDFPILTGELQSGRPEIRSIQHEDVVRTTQAELLDGEAVAVTFQYRWDAPDTGVLSPACPVQSCYSWRFEARPDGQVVLVSEGGAALPGASQPATTEAAGATEEGAPDAARTANPEAVPYEELSTWSHSDEIRERLAESWQLWNTLWVDVEITTTERGVTTVLREQAWVEQPGHSLWLSGPSLGIPGEARITSGGRSAFYKLEKAYHEANATQLIPSLLNKMIFPSWSIALREGTFEAVQREEIAGRMAVVVNYTNVEGRVSDSFWIDAATGIILRWAHYGAHLPGASGWAISQEILVTDIVYNLDFDEDLFDLAAAPPQEFTEGPELVRTTP